MQKSKSKTPTSRVKMRREKKSDEKVKTSSATPVFKG